jgi:hypothetical protein
MCGFRLLGRHNKLKPERAMLWFLGPPRHWRRVEADAVILIGYLFINSANHVDVVFHDTRYC